MTTRTRARWGAAHFLAICLVALSLFACSARAAFEVSLVDAREAAMLAPALTLEGSFGAHRVTVSAGEYYGIREARVWRAAVSSRLRAASVGIELSRLGGDLYEERTLGVLVGLVVDHDLHVDARVRGLGIAARGVDDRWTAAFDVGVTRRLLGRILLGVSCRNLTRSRIGDSPVAATTNFGAALDLQSVSIRWTLSLEGEFAPSTILGFEAELTDWLRVRAGARDAPGRLGFGFGLGRERGHLWPLVDIACLWHPQLGVSSFVSVTLER